MSYKIGLDIGSTTIKAVVLNERDEIVYKSYQRHRSRVREMALEKLSQKRIVELDEERKAQMVSNLMVVLCGNKDAQPIVNSGSIY